MNRASRGRERSAPAMARLAGISMLTPPGEGEEGQGGELVAGEAAPEPAEGLLAIGPGVGGRGSPGPGADGQVRVGVAGEVVAEVGHGGASRPWADPRDLLEFCH